MLQTTVEVIEGKLSQDVTCIGCGYNLRTLSVDASCPECGEAVRPSIERAEAHPMATVWTLDGCSWMARLWYLAAGVVWPVLPFYIAGSSNIFVEWQSGQWEDYVGMLLGGLPAVPFNLLMAFAAVALLALIAKPATLGRQRWVLFGLYTGVVIGAQYTLILCATMGRGSGVAVGLIACAIAFALARGQWKLPQRWLNRLGSTRLGMMHAWIAVGAIAVASVVSLAIAPLRAFPGMLFVLALIGSPWLYLITYLAAVARVWRSKQTGKAAAPLWWPWWLGGATYSAAWGWSVTLAIQEYAKLPTQPPHCYVCTAAARGHRWLVGSAAIELNTGRVLQVNRQMRVMKAAEIMLRCLSPRLHRGCRRLYDAVGPTLAAGMRWAWLADVTYLLLLPVSLMCEMTMRLCVPRFSALMGCLYTDDASNARQTQAPDVLTTLRYRR